jgi:hypothetical protein
MAYPTSATIYKLPFDGRIRIASQNRFVLVRWNLPKLDPITDDAVGPRPFIVRRSASKSRLLNGSEYNRSTDYIIDQVTGEVLFHFNGCLEAFDGKAGKHLGRVSQ